MIRKAARNFARRHLLNPVLLRMLGDVRGRRVLDAGCGHGYFSRILAARGAEVTAVEPAQSMSWPAWAPSSVKSPSLDPAVAATGPAGSDARIHLPNFLVVAAQRGRAVRECE